MDVPEMSGNHYVVDTFAIGGIPDGKFRRQNRAEFFVYSGG